MYYLWWFVILFRIQILEEGTGCVIFPIVHVVFICFLFAWWLFWCSLAMYPVVVIGTKSLKLVFHLHCSSCLLLWALWGRGEQDLVFGEALLMLIEEHLCLWHLVTALRACTISGSLSCVCFAHEGISLYISNSQVMSVRWVPETHFPNAENFTKTLPVLYPPSALGHNHKEVSAGGHKARWSRWCSLALGTLPSWFLCLFAMCLACKAVCGNLGSITQHLTSSI